MLNEFLLTEPMRLMEERFRGSTHFESGREAVVDHTFPPARHRQHLRRRWARYGRAAAGGYWMMQARCIPSRCPTS